MEEKKFLQNVISNPKEDQNNFKLYKRIVNKIQMHRGYFD